MSPIRPPASNAVVPTPVRDARAAFFKAVVEAPATAQRQVQTAPQPAQRVEVKAVPQFDPERPLRPGSLLDIRV